MKVKATILLLSLFVFGGCATTYTAVNPKQQYFTSEIQNNDLFSFSYKYNVLQEKGNRKYVKRERKQNIHLVTVKITNHSQESLVLGENLQLHTGNRILNPLNPDFVYHRLKQQTPLYLLYLLLSFTTLNTSDGYSTSSFPIGLILGPGITIFNVAKSASSNKAFKNELHEHNLIGRNIAPGETVYGIISIAETNYPPLHIEINE